MSDQESNLPLSERALSVLRALVEQHIREGQPVGSRTLAKTTELALSPATIRNVMSDLEEAGYLRAPHTSAGRVPTDLGYRLFVDSLLEMRPLDKVTLGSLNDIIETNQPTQQELVEQVSAFLSGITQMAGLVTLPRSENTRLRHIEFLPLSERRVLAILVIEEEVQNRILYTDRSYSSSELEQATNFLNAQFAGKELSQVRQNLRTELNAAREDMNDLMCEVIGMANAAITETRYERDEFVVAGQTNLMNFQELSSVEKLKALFDEFNQKRDIYHLLERCIDAEGVQIFIGHESGYEVFDEVSVVTASFGARDNIVGVLGVIGPTRMAYQRVIPIVDVTSKILTATLNDRH